MQLLDVITNCTSNKCLRGQIGFFLKLFVPVSYRNRRFDGCFLINDGIAFQNGDYIFRLYKS